MNRAVLLVGALAACAGTPKVVTSTDDIGGVRTRWLAAFNARSAPDIAKLYAMDAVYVPITGNRVISAAAIGNLYGRIWSRFTPHMDLEPHAVERRGDLAYESGDYRESISAIEGALEIVGAYVFTYRNDPGAGGWVFTTQVWTERKPAGAAGDP